MLLNLDIDPVSRDYLGFVVMGVAAFNILGNLGILGY